MPVSKIKLPDNTTLDIHDSRVLGIDASPVVGSSNVVTSGGVASAIAGAPSKVYVGTCATAAATVAKVVTVETFPLDANNKPLVGTTIVVKFSKTNSGTAPTLNVNGTGDASIWYNNAAYAASSNIAGYANRYTTYVWDGTYWVWVTHGTDNNTTYSAMTQANLTTGTETTGRLISVKLLRDNFYTKGEVDNIVGDIETLLAAL